MRRVWIVSLILPLIAFLTVAQVAAHHSFAMYDQSDSVLKGTVTRFRWVNPHVVLSVARVAEAEQDSTIWNLELSSPGNLTRAGLSRRSFSTGDAVEVTFRPLRNGRPGGACLSVTVLTTGEEFECGAGAAIRAGERPNLP